MSTLENLVSKIIADSETKAKQIITAAQAEADVLVAAKANEAVKQKDEFVSSAKNEAQMVKSQLMSASSIAIRDSKLKAKQELIAKVFSMALEQLKSMDEPSFFSFLEEYVPNMPIAGDEQIIVPAKYKNLNINKLNEKLKIKGKIGTLSVYEGPRSVDGGFILLKDGFENNNTYESLLDYYRDKLEKKVVETLL